MIIMIIKLTDLIICISCNMCSRLGCTGSVGVFIQSESNFFSYSAWSPKHDQLLILELIEQHKILAAALSY